MSGERSPHASHLNPRWGKDQEWMVAIGAAPPPTVGSGGQMVIEPSSPVVEEAQEMVPPSPGKEKVVEARPPASRASSKTPEVIRALPCIDLGRLVKRAGCRACPRDDEHECNQGHGIVTQNGLCETCGGYVAD
jgi:hypothetical protein